MKPFTQPLFIACMLGITICNAQLKKITIDFKNKTIDKTNLKKLKKLDNGTFYQIIVTNINQNVYKVVIEKTDTTFGPPLSVPTFASIGMGSLSELLANLKTADQGTAIVTKTEEKDSNNLTTPKMRIERKKTEPLSPQQQIIFTMDSVSLALRIYGDSLTSFLQQVNTLNDNTTRLLLSYALVDQSGTLSTALKKESSFSKLITDFQTHKSVLGSYEFEVKRQFNSYVNQTNSQFNLIQKDRTLKSRDSLIKVTYREVSTVIAQLMDSSLSTQNFTKMLASFIALENNSHDTFTSMPIQFESNKTTLDLWIVPIDTLSRLPLYKTRYQLPVHPIVVWAVSTGFYWSTLSDHAYTTTQPTTDSTYQLIKEKSSSEIGLKATIMLGFRIRHNFYWQFEAGPAVPLYKSPKPRLTIGTGFCYGHRHKITGNIGGIIGQVDRLSAAYSEGTNYKPKPTDYLTSTLNYGKYVSIGYAYTW